MLGILALTAVVALAGADERSCATLVDEAAVERMIAAAEAELRLADAYADAERDFAALIDEAGLAGSTLGRAEVRAAHPAADAWAVARR